MSRKMDKDTRESLELAINTSDGVFETISSAIDWYFECNPDDDPRVGEDFIEWNITIGEILSEDD